MTSEPLTVVLRRSILKWIVASATAALAGPAYAARALLAAPAPRRIAKRIAQLGRTRVDHYAWLKFVPTRGVRTLATIPSAIRAHLEAENRYADAVLAPFAANERRLLAAMTARLATAAAEPPLRRGDWLYFNRFAPGASHPVYRRRSVKDGREEILLDESERARGQPYYRTTGHQVSPNGRFYAWAEDIGGNDRHRICVRDLTNGTIRILVDADAYGYGGLAFAPSSRALFWIWRDARNRPTRVYRSALAGGTAELVYEEGDPAIFMDLERTAADGFIAITLSGPDTSEVRLIRANDDGQRVEVVRARQRGVRYRVEEWDKGLIAVEHSDAALDGQIIRIDAARLTPGDAVVPHRPGRQIVDMVSFARALIRLERFDGDLRVVLTRSGEADLVIDFGEPGLTPAIIADQGFASDQCRVVVQGLATPPRWVDIDLTSGKHQVVATQTVPGFDASRYQVSRIDAPADDGEMVPLTVLMRKGAVLDGRAPLLLYGYGAYGVSSDPEFSIPPTVLVDQGWHYAIAHVRGGSEKGRRWFLDGRRDKKQNSFSDFIAAARHLCRLGHSREGRVVAYGLSAGGLLVSASMNRAPGLWSGVIAKVPFVDMLNTMSDASHPLVPLFRPDWGDPLASAVDYDSIAAISPYENVHRAAYPPLLTTAGLKDDRVGYWEPAKLVAAVRHHSTRGAAALLMTNLDAGHQSSGGRDDELKEMARFYAFAQACVDGRLG